MAGCTRLNTLFRYYECWTQCPNVGSAARFGDLSPFGRFLPALGDCFLALAIFHFGDFLGDFLK